MDVQFAGMKLDDEEKAQVNLYADKFVRECEADALHIDLKMHRKAGGRANYTTILRAEKKNKVIGDAEVTDWEFHMSVKKAFDKLQKELTNKSRSKAGIGRLFAKVWGRS